MTTTPRVKRFRTRRPDLPGAEAAAPADMPGAPLTTTAAPDDPEAEIEAIRREDLTGRQLRLARRVAQRHDLSPTSDFDAVRLLRRKGIDPFQRESMLELVASDSVPAPVAAFAPDTRPARPVQVPTPDIRAQESLASDVLRIQRDIQARRRRRSLHLAARLVMFVLLPTALAAWYYFLVATPLYATKSEMVIQQADGAVTAGGSGGLGAMLGGALEANKDSIAVQGYLQSRDAMLRLDAEHGFRAHFSEPAVDPLLRLAPDATMEEMYRLYQKSVRIAYDPTEGLLKMEVAATDPATSVRFSEALIGYAEEQIDHLTQRKREDQMRDARASFEDSEANMLAAQRRVVALQERFKVMSSEAEVGLVTAQIGSLETELTRERLSLTQMRSNAAPNQARMAPIERRIATLEAEIAGLRGRLTQKREGQASLAEVQSEMLMAQADVQTRQMMLASTLQQLENARIEANRQVRYLSLSVSPVAPDEAAYPRAFENTLVTLLIFAGIYLMISMTVAILREQVTA
jgi:capsular polysaccharide transport system permease protein